LVVTIASDIESDSDPDDVFKDFLDLTKKELVGTIKDL